MENGLKPGFLKEATELVEVVTTMISVISDELGFEEKLGRKCEKKTEKSKQGKK